MELPPTLNTPSEAGHRPRQPHPSDSILRQPLTAPRSFVLAALRALHPDPVGGLTAARLYGGMAHNNQTIFFAGIDRPRSFRDDIQSPMERERRTAARERFRGHSRRQDGRVRAGVG